jgi:phosphatidylglycerophosphate synthase
MISRKSIPNALTTARLLLVPVLWAFAISGQGGVVGAGMAVAWVTDALDGYLARRWKAQSAWGSRFDSIADLAMFVSGLVWITILRPDFVAANAAPLALWVAIGVAGYAVAWARFRRIADVHLYSAKAANFLGFWFGAYLLALGEPPAPVFHVVIGVCLLASVETLIAVATCERVDESMITVFRTPRRPRRGGTGHIVTSGAAPPAHRVHGEADHHTAEAAPGGHGEPEQDSRR